MNAIVEPAFGIIPMNLVKPSAKQPRKRFNEASLQELAQSIKHNGVMQPILVRPIHDDELPNVVEIVVGERRYRASQMAGLETIPAIVRDMSDKEAAELRMVENLQREDVHPIEEAEGYESLMKEHGYNADQLAEKVGKSRSYIYGRLKFCALTPAVREMFYEGKLSASTALLVARIPVPELQEKAAKEISSHWNGEPMSYRTAAGHIQSRYMLELDSAPFAIDDAKLVPAAGSCAACPKRTGNQPELFGDVNADVCTDPDCFEVKKKAHHDIIFRQAKKKGVPVYDSKDEGRPGKYGDENFVTGDQGLWRFDRMTDDARNKNIEDALPPEHRPKPTAYIRDEDDGEMTAVYEKSAIAEALEKAGLRMTLEQHNKMIADKLNGAGRSNDDDRPLSAKELERQAQLEELERRVTTENEIRRTIYKAVRDRDGLSDDMLRILLKLLLTDFNLPVDELEDLYQFKADTDDDIAAHIEKASGAELELLFMDMLIGRTLTVSSWELEHDDLEDDYEYAALLDLAKVTGVNAQDIRETVSRRAEAGEATTDSPAEESGATGAIEVGDKVRVKEGAKGPNGKARKCCGKEGIIEAVIGDRYSVRFGPKTTDLVTNLGAGELEKLETSGSDLADPQQDPRDEAPVEKQATNKAAKPKKKSVLRPDAAWPFPRGEQ